MTEDAELPDGASGEAAHSGETYGAEASPFQPRAQKPLIRRTFPISQEVAKYPQRSLRRDVIAGVTVAALAIPSGMAYAQLAGLSPVAGLYALLLPAVAYTILGSSRQVIVGPEGALTLLVATAVIPLAGSNAMKYAALAAMLAVVVGAIAVVARIARLGWIADYFSRSVLVGYLHGVVIVLILGQVGKLFGLSITADAPVDQVREIIDEFGSAHGVTTIVGFVSLAILLVLKFVFPKVPGPLVVVLGAIAASYALGLQDDGVRVVGNIPAGLPSLAWPGVGIHDVLDLMPAALGIFAVGYADAILTARSFAGRHDQQVDANQELLAFGAANVAAGVSQGFPVGASGSRTAVNDQVGGRTQAVGLIAAAVVAIVLLFLTDPVEYLPAAVLGAVIISAAVGIIDPSAWRALASAGRGQVLIAVVTLLGVVFVGVLQALIVAVALSIVDVVARSAKPHDAVLGYVPRLGRYANVSLHPSATVTPGVVVYRLDDRLFFANASYFKSRVREAINGAPTVTTWLVLDAESIVAIDASGVEALEQLMTSLAQSGITLVVARIKGPLQARFDATGLTARIGADHFHPTVRAAVAACSNS
jgi:sulfate permease, SulP family